MKLYALGLIVAFLFASLFLSFTLASCGTSDTPICSSLFGMNKDACATNPLEHHIAITEQPILCTLDALANAAGLAVLLMVSIIVATFLLASIYHDRVTTKINTLLLRISHHIHLFDPLRFAFIRGTIQQKRNVRMV